MPATVLVLDADTGLKAVRFSIEAAEMARNNPSRFSIVAGSFMAADAATISSISLSFATPSRRAVWNTQRMPRDNPVLDRAWH